MLFRSTAVLEQLGWIENPPADPTGGSFDRMPDGSLTGIVNEAPAVFELIGSTMSQVVTHPLHSGAQWYALMARAGITATADLTYETQYKAAYEALAQTRHCPLRMSLYHMSTEADCGEPFSSSVRGSMLHKQGIKLWADGSRSEEHTSELQSHSFISYAGFRLKKKKKINTKK